MIYLTLPSQPLRAINTANVRQYRTHASPHPQNPFKCQHGCECQEREPRTQRRKEPPVLSRKVPLLKSFLDGLLGLLPRFRALLEGVSGDDALQAFQLDGVACGHQVVHVDGLDEWLDLG